MDVGNIQNLQKAQQSLKLARKSVKAIETNAKNDLVKTDSSKFGDNCPSEDKLETTLIPSQEDKDKQEEHLEASLENEKLLEEKLAKALERITQQKAKIENYADVDNEFENLNQKKQTLTKCLDDKDEIIEGLKSQIQMARKDLKTTQQNLSDSSQLVIKQNDQIEVLKQKVKTLNENLEKTFLKINLRDANGNTKLHLASRDGVTASVEMLLKLGAEVDSKNDYQMTPLHDAVTCGHFEIVKLLLQNGADVNAQNTYQNTALHFAAFGGYPKIIEILLKHAARKDLKNENYETPLQLAACFQLRNSREVVFLLKSY